ncbi:endolytic transglycosylase MltG [Denitrobacterium detoxificans]|uniref:endolytic transglycosylase MltG n=1 Tax=Denitrobacterium detoxificans TaxID=79604 RepID=UPI0026EA89EC|nr:endolytic transglycosylase MltG [Denitrobacterium detoxificans]MBE6465446.1 endolytic transglycosylase MltG [Denitrobacterium detoxificans]
MALHRRVTYSSRSSHAARHAHARGAREFRTYDTSMIKPKKHRGPLVFGLVLAVILTVLLVFGFRSCAGCSTSDVLPEGTQASFTIEQGESTSSIAQTLADCKLISRTSDFTDAVKAANAESSLKPGTYTIAGGTSVDDIISQLVAGPSLVTFTVSEGLTVQQTAQIVAEAYDGSISADDFLAAAFNASAYVSDYPFVEGAYNNSLEGFLFPKTYSIQSGDTADSVIRRMLDQYAQEVSSLDYSYAQSQGLSAYDVVKLASVVQREAASDNMATVASVFYNRLASNMALQSDATVAYVVGHDPTSDDISTDSPYNTYAQKGLPAGPICSPGLDALQAVCSPDQTNYLYFYFVQNDQGGTDYYFSETFEDHRAAIEGTSN